MLFFVALGTFSQLRAAELSARSAPINAPSNAGTMHLPAAVSPTDGAVLDAVERAAKATEAWELKGADVLSAPEGETAKLEKASQSVSRYLTIHPKDVRALLLQARVMRALIVVTPVVMKLEDDGRGHINGDTTKVQNDALSALDKALALDPNNAETYYWKARVLGLSSTGAEAVGAAEALDPMPVISAARTATRLAPTNATYREYLAASLLRAGQTAEALQELAKLPGKHPILQLVDDMDVVVAPKGAEPDADRVVDIVRNVFSGQMDVFRYPGFRARAFAVPSSPADVRAFYARIWPSIRWVKKGDSGSAFAGFRWHQDQLEPISDPSPFLGDFEKQLPPSGVLIVVSRNEGTKAGRTMLFIVNFRRF